MSKSDGWKDLSDAIKAGLRRIYLWGPPGLGKSYSAREILHERKQKTVTEITLSEDLTVQELCGMYLPKGSTFEFSWGPITRALIDGHLLINELSRASGAVLDSMLAVLDVPASLTLPSNDVIHAHDDLSIIATANHPITDLTDALQDRFETDICVSGPSPSLVTHLESLHKRLGTVVRDSWSSPPGLSPRRAIAMATLQRGGCDLPQACRLAFGSRGPDVASILALAP